MDELLRMLLVALGIGLVIFVHELGHFLAARWIGVRVEVFSLGFGPKLVGVRYRGTLYQLAALPLGGFVAVAGEDPAVRAPRPDELPSKTVAQRFLYYSGGVVMNLAFAVVVLPMVFLAGVPFERPILGEPLPGSPAWHAGLEAGTRVLAVNGSEVYDFNHIPTAVALGSKEGSVLDVERPDGTRERVHVRPVRQPEVGIHTIGVRPQRDPEHRLAVAPDSPAAKAGLLPDDRLLGVVGQPEELSPADQLQLALAEGGDLLLSVDGDQGPRQIAVTPDRSLTSPPRLGISAPFHLVSALRDDAVARTSQLAVGDRILSIGGYPIWRAGDGLRAILFALEPAERAALEVRVERGGEVLSLTWPTADRAQARALLSGIALAQAQDDGRVAVQPGEAAERAGLRSGDRVLAIDGVEVAAWADLQNLVRASTGPMTLRVLREGQSDPMLIVAEAQPGSIPFYGFEIAFHEYVFRSAHLGEAVKVGLVSSWRMLLDVWVSLQKLILREVPTDSLGGIITIGAISYSWAEAGVPKLLFFLCLLSINLAILNVLPIPVLDGGHLLFLLVEAIKGSPVSEKVFGYSQMVGMVLIVTLMVYVTYNDLMRWVFDPGS